jgi:hypothetical protein
MDEPLDLSKKRVIPEVTYSVVENLGWDAKDKKQRKIGTITQLQYIDLQTASDELKLVDQHGELLLECKMGDEYHQLLLEVGLNTILERFLKKEKLSLYSKDEIKKYGEKKYQEYKDSLSKDDKEYLENKYGKMK